MQEKYECSDQYREKLDKEVQEAKEAFLREKEKQDALRIPDILAMLKKN